VFAGAVALLPTAGIAQEQARTPSVFVGGVVDMDRLAYAGVSVPIAGASNPQGLAVRVIVAEDDSEYDASGVRIHSKQTRADLSALYQASGDWGYFDAGVGAVYANTRLSPPDPGNRQAGGRWEPVVSLSGQSAGNAPWAVSGYGSYAFTSHDSYVRADLTRALSPRVRLGVEASYDGATRSHRERGGVVLAFQPAPEWQLKAGVGGARSTLRSSPYLSLSLNRSF
jgi:hypothetical protein